MESNCRTSWSRVIMLMLVSFASADLAKDRDECAPVLVGLATCLPYVSGTAKTPTPDCCTGLKQVLVQNKKCLCVLVKDRNDPQLGLKINVTLALGLPGTCHAPANTSGCPALLHLAPNSPDAQVFEQFANSTKGNAPAPVSAAKGTPVNSSNAKDTSESREIKRWFVIEITVGLAVWYLSSVLGI